MCPVCSQTEIPSLAFIGSKMYISKCASPKGTNPARILCSNVLALVFFAGRAFPTGREHPPCTCTEKRKETSWFCVFILQIFRPKKRISICRVDNTAASKRSAVPVILMRTAFAIRVEAGRGWTARAETPGFGYRCPDGRIMPRETFANFKASFSSPLHRLYNLRKQ